DGKVDLALKLNGEEVARKTVDLKEGEDLREVLSFVPQQKDAQPGKQELVATVTVLSGPETVTDEITKSVRVIDQKVRVFVAEAGGLIHIAGRNHGPASFVGTPLADVLPVEFQAVKYAIDTRDRPQPFRPELTPAGVRSPVLSLDDDPVENLRIWKTLPE